MCGVMAAVVLLLMNVTVQADSQPLVVNVHVHNDVNNKNTTSSTSGPTVESSSEFGTKKNMYDLAALLTRVSSRDGSAGIVCGAVVTVAVYEFTMRFLYPVYAAIRTVRSGVWSHWHDELSCDVLDKLSDQEFFDELYEHMRLAYGMESSLLSLVARTITEVELEHAHLQRCLSWYRGCSQYRCAFILPGGALLITDLEQRMLRLSCIKGVLERCVSINLDDKKVISDKLVTA